MKTNELMLGNYVQDNEDLSDKIIYEIVKIECEIFAEYNSDGDEYNVTAKIANDTQPHNYFDLHPAGIPLTEKWLLDFGFSKQYCTDGYIAIDFGNIEIVLREPNEFEDCYFFRFKMGYDFDARLKYVHELQNLYFAITKSKLLLKPLL